MRSRTTYIADRFLVKSLLCFLVTLLAACWDDNHGGPHGFPYSPPTGRGLGGSVAAVSAGGDFACALLPDGEIKCWGDNSIGQLGSSGTGGYSAFPVPVKGLSGGITAISAGNDFACALTAAGGVRCWGDDSIGELGNNATVNSSSPVDVTGLSSGVSAVTAGDDFACALTGGGGVECWGDNASGQLGNNTTSNASVPINVTGLSSGVSAVTAGDDFACALTSGGGVECWGDNASGELGNGTTTPSSVPVEVTGLASGVAAVVAGYNHACALISGGGVECWGDNASGELGNGTTTPSSVPVEVTGLASGVAAITAGDLYTCAVTTAGAVECWGNNKFGQLGNNTTTNSLVPVDVTGLSSGVSAVTAGGDFACGLTAKGGVECWGDNSVGELGDDTTTDSSIPVVVSSGH